MQNQRHQEARSVPKRNRTRTGEAGGGEGWGQVPGSVQGPRQGLGRQGVSFGDWGNQREWGEGDRT